MIRPHISVVIPSFNGQAHLPPLLDSLREVDYPRDALEIIVVDDASTDGTQAEVRPRYSEVRWLRNEQNRHFAHTINHGVREAGGEYVFLLNNDTRVRPDVLYALLEIMASVENCRAVAARMLDWDGQRILYNGSYINFEGKGFEEGCALDGEETEGYRTEQLLACGGAALYHRETFRQLGGLDEDYGIYYEDADMGWRLNLAGYRVAFAPRAMVHHRLHAYMDAIAYAGKAYFYERNALWTLYKNLSDENLGRILPAVLLLASWRAQALADQARVEVDRDLPGYKKAALGVIEKQLPERLTLFGRAGDSHLRGVNRFFDGLADLRAKRECVQALRTVPDAVILRAELFPDPFRIWAFNDDHYRYLRAAGYEETWRGVIELFNLTELFPGRALPQPKA